VTVAVWLLAQVADGGIDVGQALVSYGVAAPLVGYVLWDDRRRDKAHVEARERYDADVAAHRTQLDLERKANRELYDRIIAQQERMAPVLEMAARALDHATGSQR
jgi:hypothetical protein